MKILHVLSAPRAEGTPRLVLDWLSIRDHEQEILFLAEDGDLKNEFRETGAWQYYNTAFTPNMRNVLKIIFCVRDVCRDRKPDLVIAWSMGFSHWITIGARLSSVKNVIAHCGNPPGEGIFHKYINTYVCFLLGRIFGNRIVACSNYVKTQYAEIPLISKKRIFVVYNSLNIKKFLMNEYIPVQKTDVSMIAYLEDARDHETLLKAWKEVEKDLPDVILNIIGDGILRKKLEALTTSLSLQNVCFQGRVTNVEHYLWNTKVYVFSTLREGFGITLLEALAAGCQVVATDVPACREVLDNGMYGDLIPLRNSTLLANAIVEQYRIMLSPSEIESRQQYIQKFTPEKMLNSYVQTIFQGLPQTQQLS